MMAPHSCLIAFAPPADRPDDGHLPGWEKASARADCAACQEEIAQALERYCDGLAQRSGQRWRIIKRYRSPAGYQRALLQAADGRKRRIYLYSGNLWRIAGPERAA